ncbi:TetR/AcrR family transcriptional regulator [Burkholderia sp. FERM BP-3421]|jgi:TetR/AcrR family transcriptional repressor of nem operon|uniref:TetR/AcrR family transcriptional regulator n=1 Tax=Burkholderia sp. FERM BP-3421 TaxID=1494466 RepID=UPI00235E72DD|nr:TetR/AcrR family transcriptional regulator [Burkholderia sp. FERM BP-3421]WDD91545.1 TetR/AcrR family transcriptional regulator [Burkholderia sp. FERM BP-3421]
MRYDPEHKARTRERIEAVASARFREEGIDAVGVASLMETAGLTHGGFYAHFPSKEALVASAVAVGFEQTANRLREGMTHRPARPRPVAFMQTYLNEQHRDHPDSGCVAATLGAEISRSGDAVRQVFTEQLESLVACATPDDGAPRERRETGLAAVALAVGALILSRAVDDPALSKELIAAGVNASKKLAD